MEIRLKTLHLENFKCHKSLTIDFDGKNTSIYGDNATGKTSIYDAFVWLLFGKDSAGNGEKNIEVKPLAPDGSVLDHQAVTEVEAVLLADGEEISLKRTYQEVWSTKRGCSEATYDGNTSEYYVNGVPCKANAYKAKVAELVDEDKFRLLTTVSYFSAGIPWQKRRETLFELFGVVGDKQIMETDGRFAPLLEAMGRLSLEDFRKVLSSKRKGFMTTRNEVPARISECEKTIQDLSALDFDGADAEMGILSARLEQLQKELLSIEHGTSIDAKRMELDAAKFELEKLEAENQRFRDSQKREDSGLDHLMLQYKRKTSILEDTRNELKMCEAGLKTCELKISDARAQWKAINAESYNRQDTCPTCGQRLPQARIQQALDAFLADKKSRLDGVVKDSEYYKGRKEECQRRAEEYKTAIQDLTEEVSDLESRISEEKRKADSVTITDLPDYAEKKDSISHWISNSSRELEVLQADSNAAASDLRRRISEVKAEIAQASEIAGKRSAYQYAQSRIAQLREDAQAEADNLGQLDRMLYLMEQFSRYKASFVENGINDRFRLANFRLFREQANGGVEDRCDVTYDGVPYMGLNNGMKINVGIDIINTLSRAYGVTVPLFVDNAESVTELEECGCQVVRLVVSENDKELRIDHEN